MVEACQAHLGAPTAAISTPCLDQSHHHLQRRHHLLLWSVFRPRRPNLCSHFVPDQLPLTLCQSVTNASTIWCRLYGRRGGTGLGRRSWDIDLKRNCFPRADLFQLKKCSVVKIDIHSLCRIFSVCKWCMHLQTMPREYFCSKKTKSRTPRLCFRRTAAVVEAKLNTTFPCCWKGRNKNWQYVTFGHWKLNVSVLTT